VQGYGTSCPRGGGTHQRGQDVPEAQDEHDSYVFDFYELLVSGASRIEI
jgi:hypothetical protein